MHALDSCFYSGCTRPVSTIFRHEPLCLEHFCGKSYEFLDSVDQHLQSNPLSPACTTEQLHVADECARKALDICLSKMILNNLDRARLLDILLWSGDIVSCSRSANTATSKDNAKMEYESPQFRRLGTGGVQPN
jgi:hypothetical protein